MTTRVPAGSAPVALDPATTGQVLALLDERRHEGLAVLVATHDPVVADRADRVLTIDDHGLRGGGERP